MSKQNKHSTLIETKRLILRPINQYDASRIHQYRNQPEVALFQGWIPASEKEVEDYATAMLARAPGEKGHWYQVALQLKVEAFGSTVIGDVAFCIDKATQKQAELGIALDIKYQKQGYAKEAIQGLIKYLFQHYNLHRIHVVIDPDNNNSRNLFKKTGFRQEGHLKQSSWFKEKWCDDIMMAILRSEWC